MRKKNIVENQEDNVVSKGQVRPDNEHILANPDRLTEAQGIYADSQPTRPQELMGEAVDHLQGRQREVYILTMREGKSFADTAVILGISRSAVQIYRQRAIAFVKAYCRQAVKREL